jgi:hypothetical protein
MTSKAREATTVATPEEVIEYVDDPERETEEFQEAATAFEVRRTSARRPPRPVRTADRPRRTPRGDGRPSVLIDGEVLYRVEGDLLLTPDELAVYQETRSPEAAPSGGEAGPEETGPAELGEQRSALVGILEDGKIVRWAPGTILRYCVLRQTFPSDDWYDEVVENMQRAVDDWAATCGVEFEYVHSADDSDSLRPPEVLFPVRHISAGGAFIAAAFFPTDPVRRRRLLIDPSYHSTSFDRVGVLRHELGHVLGFRHEHIRSGAPAVCPDEDTTGTIDLTAYDPRSVMHYFCGGIGSKSLAITDLDRAGSQRVYGIPLTHFELLHSGSAKRKG